MKILVTGGAGLHRHSVVRHCWARARAVVNLDKLTYAGSNPPSARSATAGAMRWRSPISPTRAAVARIFARASPRRGDASRRRDPCRSLDRRARRFHPDQSRRHLHPARSRAALLGGARRCAAKRGSASITSRPTRCSARSADGRCSRRERALSAEQPLCRHQGRRRSSRARLASHLWLAGGHHQLLEQLRAVAVPGKARSR